MKRFAFAILILASAIPAHAADAGAGRWEGVVRIPGRAVPVIVDLARGDAGEWTGSVTMQGLGIKGAPLAAIAVSGDAADFHVAGVLASRQDGPARFSARFAPPGGTTMHGDFFQGGNRAPFALTRAGAAQVEPARRGTAIAAALEGTWVGQYELGGYPRRVTIKLANAAGVGTAEFVVVGKRTSNLPVDIVTQEDRILRIESNETGISFEGRVSADGREIIGIFEQGPLEAPLQLRRQG